ncbi:hypothetical protein CH330_08180 [candidate division WOR-3 bacterium JGI_Cruoil_03_51_56]|uniref:Uncharacterized protein n=1 Tax=candidate division WOR-3 bacterium JGI_Cruoil_03_51_56 TaxID=1973747 RepID=A0A235BQS1_UNCW3|nr:MAG: hypothetical protein CH330_08180 [candidate division WOR-3 bacterium JGI_Cruoil_03_51_56]
MEKLLARLKNSAVLSQRIAKRLVAYHGLLSEPVSNAFRREKALNEIKRLMQALPDTELHRMVEEWCSKEQTLVAQGKEEFRFRFGTNMANGLNAAGLKVKGQLPVLRVGMFSLRVDFASGTAIVFWGPEVERLKGGVSLAPDELVKILVSWTKNLGKRASDPVKLKSQLFDAYHRILVLNGLEPGTRIPLLDILAELVLLIQPRSFRVNPARAKFVEYPRVRFSYDLYRLKTSGEPMKGKEQLRLHVATFDATTQKTRALWVPDNEEGEGTYYSYISFSREDR